MTAKKLRKATNGKVVAVGGDNEAERLDVPSYRDRCELALELNLVSVMMMSLGSKVTRAFLERHKKDPAMKSMVFVVEGVVEMHPAN